MTWRWPRSAELTNTGNVTAAGPLRVSIGLAVRAGGVRTGRTATLRVRLRLPDGVAAGVYTSLLEVARGPNALAQSTGLVTVG